MRASLNGVILLWYPVLYPVLVLCSVKADFHFAAADVGQLSMPRVTSERHFYRLNGSSTFLKRTSDSYWGYITLDSLTIYEKIYHEICKINPESNGYVWCELNFES